MLPEPETAKCSMFGQLDAEQRGQALNDALLVSGQELVEAETTVIVIGRVLLALS